MPKPAKKKSALSYKDEGALLWRVGYGMEVSAEGGLILSLWLKGVETSEAIPGILATMEGKPASGEIKVAP